MKWSALITSVESKVEILDNELQRVLDKKHETVGFWQRKREAKSLPSIDGYESFSSYSVNIPFKGMVEIYSSNFKQITVNVIAIPIKTQFLVTCISRNNGYYIPALEASLS